MPANSRVFQTYVANIMNNERGKLLVVFNLQSPHTRNTSRKGYNPTYKFYWDPFVFFHRGLLYLNFHKEKVIWC